MTTDEKAAAYDIVMKILNDRIALEKHYRQDCKNGTDAINFLRANAYGEIVKAVLGIGSLPNLPI